MANEIPWPDAGRLSGATGPPSVADRPRVRLVRAMKQASIRTAERKLRHAGLSDALHSALPSLAPAAARPQQAGVRAPRASRQSTDAGA